MEEYKLSSHARNVKMAELAEEAKNNNVRMSKCKCPGTFANVLALWLEGGESRNYDGDWHNYNGIDVFSVRITGRFGTFRKNFFKTRFAKVKVNGEMRTLEIPEDPAFYTYAHRIMSDIEEHDIVIKQYTDGRFAGLKPSLKAQHFINKHNGM